MILKLAIGYKNVLRNTGFRSETLNQQQRYAETLREIIKKLIMIKDIKKLKKLEKLQNSGKVNIINTEKYTPETLKNEIENLRSNIAKELNGLGWFLMFLIFIPLALMQFGFKWEVASMGSYFFGGILVGIILPKITGRHY